MALVGPGAQVQTDTDILPLLNGATEYEYVTILNPLKDDFAIRVAQSIPVNMPFDIYGKTALIQNESDVARALGFPLKNPDFRSRKHIVNDTVIPAGKTINLKGNEAQVAVRQLVNEILQREGKSRLSADPNLRHEVEQRIIIKRGSIQELMDISLRSISSQMDEAIAKSNKEEDEPFPELNNPGSRRPGRPKKQTN